MSVGCSGCATRSIRKGTHIGGSLHYRGETPYLAAPPPDGAEKPAGILPCPAMRQALHMVRHAMGLMLTVLAATSPLHTDALSVLAGAAQCPAPSSIAARQGRVYVACGGGNSFSPGNIVQMTPLAHPIGPLTTELQSSVGAAPFAMSQNASVFVGVRQLVFGTTSVHAVPFNASTLSTMQGGLSLFDSTQCRGAAQIILAEADSTAFVACSAGGSGSPAIARISDYVTAPIFSTVHPNPGSSSPGGVSVAYSITSRTLYYSITGDAVYALRDGVRSTVISYNNCGFPSSPFGIVIDEASVPGSDLVYVYCGSGGLPGVVLLGRWVPPSPPSMLGSYLPNRMVLSSSSCSVTAMTGTMNPLTGTWLLYLACSQGGVKVGKADGTGGLTFADIAQPSECVNPGPLTADTTSGALIMVCVGGASVPASILSTMCSPGTHQNTDLPLLCDSCETGRYQMGSDASSCTQCPPGTYNLFKAQNSQAACLPCSAGTYNPLFGSSFPSACIPCSAGSIAPSQGTASCSPCPPGYWQNSTGAVQCVPCPPNTFNSVSGANSSTFCIPCPVSAPLSPLAASSLSQCQANVPCPAGYYSQQSDAVPCLRLCPSGSACTAGVMAPCAAGTYSTTAAASTCTLCPAGRFSTVVGSSTAANCTACPQGTYNSLLGQGVPYACVTCGPGYYSDAIGATTASSCRPCSAGSASGSSGVAACLLCSPGYWQNLTAALQCHSCPINTYNPAFGAVSQAACIPCPITTPSAPPGTSSLAQCSAGGACAGGLYTPVNAAPCSAQCQPGSYCVQGVSTLCPPGSYSSIAASPTCTDCGVGFYSAASGSSSALSCAPCPLSTYSHNSRSSSCVSCPAGTTTTSNASASSAACHPLLGCGSGSVCPLSASTSIPSSLLLPTGSALLMARNENDSNVFPPSRQGESLRAAAFGSMSSAATQVADSSSAGGSCIFVAVHDLRAPPARVC